MPPTTYLTLLLISRLLLTAKRHGKFDAGQHAPYIYLSPILMTLLDNVQSITDLRSLSQAGIDHFTTYTLHPLHYESGESQTVRNMSLQDEDLHEDGLTPLLPGREAINGEGEGDHHHDGEIVVRQRGRKLIAFGLLAGCLATADVVLSTMCCTGKFSSHWKQYLGAVLYWLLLCYCCVGVGGVAAVLPKLLAMSVDAVILMRLYCICTVCCGTN